MRLVIDNAEDQLNVQTLIGHLVGAIATGKEVEITTVGSYLCVNGERAARLSWGPMQQLMQDTKEYLASSTLSKEKS